MPVITIKFGQRPSPIRISPTPHLEAIQTARIVSDIYSPESLHGLAANAARDSVLANLRLETKLTAFEDLKLLTSALLGEVAEPDWSKVDEVVASIKTTPPEILELRSFLADLRRRR